MAVQTFNGGSWCWHKILQLRSLCRPFMKHILGGTGSLIHSWHYNWHVEGPSYVKVGHRIVYDYAVPFSAKLSSVITKSDSFWLAARSDELVVGKIVCVFVPICVCVYL